MTVGNPMIFKGDVEDRDKIRQVADRVMRRISSLAIESERHLDISFGSINGVLNPS
jgi:hypothetical protein